MIWRSAISEDFLMLEIKNGLLEQTMPLLRVSLDQA